MSNPIPATVTETIRADQLTTGRAVILICERIEIVTAIDLTRNGFVQFFTDDRPEGTNLPYTYQLDDPLTALT